jgi:hypothetical protein
MAGGMGWGIRGQYGHETGAMIAGLLISLVMVRLFLPGIRSLSAARIAAMGAIAIGFGGSMTYGQTVGLTHDGPLIGNTSALMWGLLGLAIKGGIWIGFAGVFLGMAVGGKTYRWNIILFLMLSMIALFFVGKALLNSPFAPDEKQLPFIYFSDHWNWEPGAELKPRPEVWGGLLLALAGLISYVAFVRKDTLAWRLGAWGIVGGAVGFSLGQSVQAFHAWNSEVFQSGVWVRLDPHMNWWNMMEITFGAIAGAVIGLGGWLNRKRIKVPEEQPETLLRPSIEWMLLSVHLVLLILVEFGSIDVVDLFYDIGLIMAVIPMVAVVGGRYSPYIMVLPVVAVPIAGKTLRQLVYREEAMSAPLGWVLFLVVPLLLFTWIALRYARSESDRTDRSFVPVALLSTTWFYFGINFAFFHYPWPWAEWTGRTPSGIIFIICAFGLTLAALLPRKSRGASASTRDGVEEPSAH